MILCCHQLKVGICPGFHSTVAHIYHDFFLCLRYNPQRLPCIQSAESPAYILGSNTSVDNNGIIQFPIIQNSLCCLKLYLQQLPVRMILTADLIHGINLNPQCIYGLLSHIRSQHRMKVILIKGHNFIHQSIIIIEINFGNGYSAFCIITCKSKLQLLSIDRLGKL